MDLSPADLVKGLFAILITIIFGIICIVFLFLALFVWRPFFLFIAGGYAITYLISLFFMFNRNRDWTFFEGTDSSEGRDFGTVLGLSIGVGALFAALWMGVVDTLFVILICVGIGGILGRCVRTFIVGPLRGVPLIIFLPVLFGVCLAPYALHLPEEHVPFYAAGAILLGTGTLIGRLLGFYSLQLKTEKDPIEKGSSILSMVARFSTYIGVGTMFLIFDRDDLYMYGLMIQAVCIVILALGGVYYWDVHRKRMLTRPKDWHFRREPLSKKRISGLKGRYQELRYGYKVKEPKKKTQKRR